VAFRKDTLQAIGGFDPQFRVAGDDVDVCWRLREGGSTLGFSPSAVVWHHRRKSVRAYWRQQCGYGEAEALLERKWPAKYNAAGHVRWSGRVYAESRLTRLLARGGRIYHGTWGTAPFQPLHQATPRVARSLPALPDWYLSIAALTVLSALGVLWAPLLLLLPVLGFAAFASLAHAWLSAAPAPGVGASRSPVIRLRLRALTAFLHLLQPMARLSGHLRGGLVPWRRRGETRASLPRRRTSAIWSERWRPPEERLRSIESSLRGSGIPVLRGGAHDRWDLEVQSGPLGSARLIMGVEDHALGRQLVRLRWWPRCALARLWLAVPFAALGAGAGHDKAWGACALLAAVPVALSLRALRESAAAMDAIAQALDNER
jgi:hypothetical protein